ncbi:MAG: hypothetical protein KF897_00175 [Opitutaceae bacterium]|nr:hypothetical protein [Opitutaceae bacterium]
MNPETVREYELNGLPLAELEAEVDRLWAAVRAEPELQREAGLSDRDREMLGRPRTDQIELKPDGQHVDPVLAGVIVAFTPLAVAMATQVWDKIILPRLIRRFGDRKIKPRRKQP